MHKRSIIIWPLGITLEDGDFQLFSKDMNRLFFDKTLSRSLKFFFFKEMSAIVQVFQIFLKIFDEMLPTIIQIILKKTFKFALTIRGNF